MTNCTFLNNTSIVAKDVIDLFNTNYMKVPDIAQINPEIGASIFFQGLNLFINITVFIGNTGFKGGAIYLSDYFWDLHQNVYIVNCYFKGNRGNVGAAINLSIYLKFIDTLLLYCIFHSNIGKSINFLNHFKYKCRWRKYGN